MAFVNNYVPSPPTPRMLPNEELYGPTPYDINFAYPIHDSSLESDRLKLVPFIPAEHAAAYWDNMKDQVRDAYRYLPISLNTLPETLSYIELGVRRDPYTILFAVLDKTRPDPAHPRWAGSLAGLIGLYGSAHWHEHATAELGFVVVFPAFQRTHVARGMVGLMLRYALELPRAAPRPGLGLRRVQWTTHPENVRSMRLAQSAGLQLEGTIRWARVMGEGVVELAKLGREGDAGSGRFGRDSALLAVGGDDWEAGVRERAEDLINGMS